MSSYLEIERTKSQQKLSWKSMFYNIETIDLLIISICGAGIFVCLETIKFSYENELPITFTLRGAGVVFLIGIIANFISHFCNYKKNKLNDSISETKTDAEKKTSEDKRAIAEIFSKESETYTKLTTGFNYASVVLMFTGLTLTMIFFLITF